MIINGRVVRSPVVNAALQDAFHLVLPKGRLPVTLLYLRMPPSEVDVNVHPTKSEVRFFSPNTVREWIVRAFRQHLGLDARNTLPEMSLGRDRNENLRLSLDSVYPPGRQALPPGAQPAWLPRPLPDSPDAFAARARQVFEGPSDATGARPNEQEADAPQQAGATPARPGTPAEARTALQGPPSSWGARLAPEQPLRAPGATQLNLAALRYIGQLADTFLLLEDEDGLVVVDQHVAHERVRVEALIDGARTGQSVVQPLLMPLVVELTPVDALALERGREVLERLGFEVDPLGPGSIAVRAAPAALPLVELEETLRMLARRLQSEGGPPPDPADLIEEALVMAACKGAIKAHDPLSPAQVRALLEKLDRTRHPFSCPHGRPAYFRLPLQQIEREFGRLGFG